MNQSLTVELREVVIKLAMDTNLDSLSTEYVLRRLVNEGYTYLTKILPQLSKAVLHGLEKGYIELPTNFRNCKSRFSRYFWVWLGHLFDKKGFALANPCPIALRNLRQFCDYLYKLSVSFSKEEETAAYEKAIELEVENSTRVISPNWIKCLSKGFTTLFRPLTEVTVVDVLQRNRPRYTPGAFFGSEYVSESNNAYKALPSHIIGLCDKRYRGIAGFFRSYYNRHEKVRFVDEGKTSKTLLVPKDSRGPRIISKEPLNLLKLQMSFFDYTVNAVEHITRGRVNFLNQEVNRELARESSVTRNLTTLDLKDASDRVLFKVALGAFRNSPYIKWFLLNARSTSTLINGTEVPLHKVAGMGSGLTFPLLAMLSYVSICCSVSNRLGLPLTKVGSEIYVYGDDIICPTKWRSLAIEGLEASGLAVNRDKSFSNSHFRESCGGDYLHGVAVSPVRLKLSNAGLCRSAFSGRSNRVFTLSKIEGLVQLDRHCRELVKTDLTNLASYYYDLLELRFGKAYGYTSGDSPTLGRYSKEPIYIDDEFMHTRLIPTSQTEKFTRGCPYKYLATKLRSSGDDRIGLPFGELVIPRKVSIRKRRVRSIILR